MRMSRLLVRTLREAPADAEVVSHQLLVRAGYIRRLASGVYTFLPLGLRVLARVERVIREELDAAGCQELLLPVLHPIELWEQSGRAALFGNDALPAMTVDARGGTFVLGPTHEEVVTVTVGAEVESYRQLPLTVYQIQVKFRDEARPRFGLLRTRELIMADAYSFDVDKEAMQASYQTVFDAYLRIFARLGLSVTPVEAQSGAIGGDVNHEFMVPSVAGEDHFVSCPSCGYAANVEAATRAVPRVAAGDAEVAEAGPVVDHHTPDRPGITEVVSFFADQGVGPADLLKCVATVDDEGRATVLLVPGDREARLPGGWRLFDDTDFAAHPWLVKGFIGPTGQQDHDIRVVADVAVARPGPWITGANRLDHHLSGVLLESRLHRRRLGILRPGGGGGRLPPVRGRRPSGAFGRGRPHLPARAQVLRGHAGRHRRGRGRQRDPVLDGVLRHGGEPTAGGGGRGAPRRTGADLATRGLPLPGPSGGARRGAVRRGGRGRRPAVPALGGRGGRRALRRPGRVARGQVRRR